MLLSKHDVPGLHRLLTVALRNGASIRTVLAKLNQAIAGIYSPRDGWSEREYDIAYLVKSIGGPKLLYALQRHLDYLHCLQSNVIEIHLNYCHVFPHPQRLR
jgi:hypothetical protein